VTEVTGIIGVFGCELITTLAVATETHPTEFVTVKLYVPAANVEMVLLVVEPLIFPGLIVQLPDGKPLKFTVPVAELQFGCVIVPTIGVAGVDGSALIVAELTTEVHPPILLIITL